MQLRFACRLLMSVIKGCLKEENKELKKLVTIYWEVGWMMVPCGHFTNVSKAF